MKRFLVYLASILLGATGAFGVALATKPTENEKVTICHATSSEENPWVRIVVSENAIGGHFENPGTPKAGHEDDLLLGGEQECPVDNENNNDPGGEPNDGGTGGGQAEHEDEVEDVTNHSDSLPAVGADGK